MSRLTLPSTTRISGHGEAVEDGLLVAFDAVGEGVQVGLVVGVDGGEPVARRFAVRAGEDLGELGDVAGARVQVRGSAPGPGRVSSFPVVEVVRGGEDPAGQVAGLGGRGRRRWLPGRTRT